MKRREPPLTSSGVRRRARFSLEKRLCDIAEDCRLTTQQTLANRADPPDNDSGPINDTSSDSDSRIFPLVDSFHIDTECVEVPIESDSDAEDENVSLLDSLADWAVQFSVSLVALTALLSLLRLYHPELPKDARTILKTQTVYKIQEKCGGLYHHRGILTALRNTLAQLVDCVADGFSFRLQINIDGLPLFKSTNIQLWPILGLLLSVPVKEPVVIGLFCGTSKPRQADEYLQDFRLELQQLQQGFDFRGKKLIKLDTVVCDTPARAFVKNTKAHNAYHGCDKCSTPGLYINGRMTFPITDCTSRTDLSFFERADEDHHHEGPHVFSDLNFGMVTGFPLDYMHLVCLGVMRRLLNIWLRGPLKFRLSSVVVERILESLTRMGRYIPTEFARKPRSLREVDRWKATELRQFLLYTGTVVLSPHLESNLYNNFMLLFTGISILVSPQLCSVFSNYANTLLTAFVCHFGDLYGRDNLVYNVHSLVHLSADAQLHGCLDTISAFPYENYLHKLKKFVRKPEFPLAQIIRRLSEEGISRIESSCTSLRRQHYIGPVPDGLQAETQYREMHTEKWTMKMSTCDNVFAIGRDICVVHNITQSMEGIHVVFKVFTEMERFFTYPMNSDFLRIFIVSQPTGPYKVAKASEISHKCVLLPYKDKFIVMPFLHSDRA